MIKKSFLIVCRRPPYGESYAREALDVAMACAAFDQPVAMLFLGDGVLQLSAAQHGAAIGQKSHDKQLSALPLYDIETLYADAQALQTRRLD
ncbi:MAG TPA: sulfurtransferase complex subunit TusC, partial [Spongiibacteraceae bacterium]|nr:sulfurtransferase complex subunit TusC [Spongiibacteraceae bacterium]